MRLTQIARSLEFGKLAKIRGIVYFRLSPFEQKAFAGAITNGVPNMIRRFRENFFVIGQSVGMHYMIYTYIQERHEYLVRKKPGDYADDE